jgi:hypothetical protein
MAVQVRFSPGHDIYYLPGRARPGGGGGERTAGGYYVNAAQVGEAPGRWFGRGAHALGLPEGSEVGPGTHEQVFSQVDPRTGAPIGRQPGRSNAETRAARAEMLGRLLAAEPHATAARRHELERQAAQAFRQAPPYTDFTVSYSKSVSVVHASIRENARRAALAGDLAAEAYWADMEARFAAVLFEGAAVAMRHLEQWAMTRTGPSRQVDDQQFSRYEPAGLTVSMWLQGTSRDGDPHDHVHCAIARMCLTLRDGAWRAVDTMSLRNQGGTAKLLAAAYHQSAFTGALGLRWWPGSDGAEVEGVTDAQRAAYSSRGEEITRELRRATAQFERDYGRAPNRAEVRRIKEEVWSRTRKPKDDAPIDWAALAARWDETLGGELAQIALDLGLGPGGAAQPRERGGPGPAPGEQLAAMGAALARVQAKHAAWTRAQLCGELAEVLPPSMAELPPQAAMALALEMADRIIAGEVQPVDCLDAPDPADGHVPADLWRELDGHSVFVRPGRTRYATEVQLSREQRMLAQARAERAPRLSRAKVARLLRADREALDAQLRESVRAEESRAIQASGLSAAQQAAAYHVLTSPRRAEIIEAPAGAGKTHVLAAAAAIARQAGVPVYGLGPTQQAVHVLQAAAAEAGVDLSAWNTAQFLGQRRDGTYREPQPVERGGILLVDEGSMVGGEHAMRVMDYAARAGLRVIAAQDRGQLTAVEDAGAFAFLADELGVVRLPDPVRFAAEWERVASLRLRDGDTEVLTEYADHGRVAGAPPELAKDMARRAYVAEHLAGRAPLLMAASNELVEEMNEAIRSDLRHLGLVRDGGPEAVLMNGKRAGVGDLIVLREIHHDAESGEPGRGLANGDTLEITSIDGGRVMVRRVLDADAATSARRYTPEFAFPYTVESQLAYAVTGHRGQGRTVTAVITLFTGGEAREWAYPAMTRGREDNYAIVFTLLPTQADPRTGTREAPELARWARQQNECAARDRPRDPASERAEDAQAEALGILSRILTRPERELAATQWQAREARNAHHLGRLHHEWQHLAGEINRARYEAELRAVLPEALRDIPLGPAATWLWRTLRGAEAVGLPSAQVLADAVGSRPLTGARDIAAVVDARARKATAGLVPLLPRPWTEQVPDVADPALRAYMQRRAEQMDARTERLAAHVTQTAPTWAVAAAGPVPADPMERLEWQHRIAPVAAYRQIYGWEHETEPIGPEPTADTPDKRAAWHGAFAALGPPRGLDLRAEPDSRLWLMLGTYGTVTAEAPRFVGRELRAIRVQIRDCGIRADRHVAEVRAARERGDEAAAQRHADREASARAGLEHARAMEARLANADSAYREWEQTTQRDRLLPLAARAELMRRHPQADMPPLRSAEPEPPSKQERAQLLWPQRDRQGSIQHAPERDAEPEREEKDDRRDPMWPRVSPTGELEPDTDANRAARETYTALREEAAQARARQTWQQQAALAREQAQDRGRGRERAQAQADVAGPQTDPAPRWVQETEERAQHVRERMAERTSERIPHPDNHEWGDVGSAWPGLAEPERDAILQPPKPEISPAPEITDRAAEPERAYTRDEAEAEAAG